MIEETALDPWARSLTWRATPDPERLENFTVAIIGAGMGGLNAAVQLQRAGIRYSIIEKNAEVGGTWNDNRYPGARVDTPSRAYMNLFGVDFPYPYQFGPHAENQKYFDWVADEFDLRGDIVFNTEVHTLTWDEQAAMWEIRMVGPRVSGPFAPMRSSPGSASSAGRTCPRSRAARRSKGNPGTPPRWPEDMDLRGKRIAVIGTGCTGYQLVPELALEANMSRYSSARRNGCSRCPATFRKCPNNISGLIGIFHSTPTSCASAPITGPARISPRCSRSIRTTLTLFHQ